MFAKLAIKNIKRSIKDYAVYFFTLVLGVAIFYVFNSLGSQSVMLDVTERVKQMLDLVDMIMNVVSVFVSCIVGALIIYASRFLIKRRGKEFGIYLTLGMSKRKISMILLIETFLIGLLSLAVGLGLGIIVSQFTSVLVANMFDANMTNFHFVFSLPALLQTLFYFGIIYVVVMIFNTIIISRQKLINLLSSNRRNEKIKNKNLWVCTAVFLIGAVILGYAYYLVTDGLESLIFNAEGPEVLLKPIIMGIIATFLLFWSLSGILLRIVMSFKKVYYHKLNSFVLRQFSSKINTTVASMSVICLMLFVTICILGSAIAINQTLHRSINQALPFDAQIESISHNKTAPSIEDIYKKENVILQDVLTDIETYYINIIETEAITKTGTTTEVTGFAIIEAEVDGDLNNVESYISIREFIYQSDYNRIAKYFSLPAVELADDECAVLADFRPSMEALNEAMKLGLTIKIGNQTLHPQTDTVIYGTIDLSMSGMNAGMYIIPDSVKLDDIYSKREVKLGNFLHPEKVEDNEHKLLSISNRFFGDFENNESARTLYYYNVELRQSIIDNNVGTSALVTFVGLYLGIIFLISSAAILALKELSESSDNRDKYTILRKIGASNGMLNRALFWQIFIFFLFPLLIAMLHAVFGLKFCEYILVSLGGVEIAKAIPGVALILLGIYGGYFLITYICSRNMIREHRN